MSVKVNGIPAVLLFDTGTAWSAISRELAGRIGFRGPASDLAAEARNEELPIIGRMAVQVRIGALPALSDRVNVIETNALPRILEAPVDGILGAEVLQRLAFSLDYQRQEIRLWSPGKLSPAERAAAGFAQANPVKLGADTEPFGVSVMLNGTKRAVLPIDTGSDRTTLPQALVTSLGAQPKGGRSAIGTLYGNRSEGRARIGSLSIGGITLNNVPISVVESAESDFAFLLGADLLSRFRTLFDPQAARLYLIHQPNRAASPGREVPWSVPLVQMNGKPAPVILAILRGQSALFLVDEKQPASVIDKTTVERLGLPIQALPNGASTVRARLGIGNHRPITISLRVSLPVWRRGKYLKIDGVLGADVLKQMVVAMDLRRGVLEFVSPG